ncbi:DHA2 family efflux MFS transporter permease subunit [Phenylobacterium sp.]|uniref:DHA2 family efflux MFS transporter permease subunit n=1 Tax=Phenylobacterium sp. TaxID=1871053 RepID=UPI0025FD5F57|nr:DHA2 family efflux MFS transporter permease subunit [Phenylobacterium sp.]
MSEPSPPDPTPEATLATWCGFALMGLGMFMAILDVQVVATSLPTIQQALAVPAEQMSWIQTAYLIAEVIAIPLTGFLTRWLSMRWLFVVGVSLFTLASAGCAASADFTQLIALRVVQGLSGGVLIPAVFSAVFLLFPMRRQAIATTLAGMLAVLAPTVGPIVGGWITETYSWRWLFLINVAPGVLAAAGAALLLPRGSGQRGLWRTLDLVALGLLTIGLAALEIGLKEAPGRGWSSPLVLGLLALSAASLAAFVRRVLGREAPIVDLRTLRDRNFAIGSLLSFSLGIGLFGSVYLMPVFLAFVRGHQALRIGEIMLVTGAAQLVTAPLAVALERRVDARLLSGFGFLLFGVGLALSARQTGDTDFHAMIVPQIVRGAAIMFCLLPPTRLALGRLEAARIPDASGLFNLMRNLGGAIGLALIDTVIYGRLPHHAAAIVARLQAGDRVTAQAVGIPLALFDARPPGPIDPGTAAMLEPMVRKLALVQSINEAWAVVAVLTFAALLVVPFARPAAPAAKATA